MAGYVLNPIRLFCLILLLISLSALYRYLGAGRDNVFITLWAGKTLGTATWFINYNGESQEISSSILGALDRQICLSLLRGNLLSGEQTVRMGSRAGDSGGHLAPAPHLLSPLSPTASAIAAVALLGFNPSFAYWSLGGLETPYYALLILLYAALRHPPVRSRPRPTSLACLALPSSKSSPFCVDRKASG